MLLLVLEALALIFTGDVTLAPFPGEDTLTVTEPNAAVIVSNTNAIVSFKSASIKRFSEVVETVCLSGDSGGIGQAP